VSIKVTVRDAERTSGFLLKFMIKNKHELLACITFNKFHIFILTLLTYIFITAFFLKCITCSLHESECHVMLFYVCF
jgi:hypothetical protein